MPPYRTEQNTAEEVGMIRRTPRALPVFSKSLKRVELIGGDAAEPEVCYGYLRDGASLVPLPAASESRIINVSAVGLYDVAAHPSFGCALIMFSGGDVAVWQVDDDFCFDIAALPRGEPFSVEARGESGEAYLATVCGDTMRVYEDLNAESALTRLPRPLYGGVVHCGRLFAADADDRYTVRWSGLRITDWTDGIEGSGYATLDGETGEILALENLGDDLLCVRERGFTVIRALADSRNFRIAPSQCVVPSEGGIMKGGVVGGKYYFTKPDGLYSYDGETVRREYLADGRVLTEFGRAYVTGDGQVYAQCVYGGIRCLMRYDAQSGAAGFFGADCERPLRIKDRFVCVKYNEFYELSASFADGQRIWRSKYIDVGESSPEGYKILKDIEVDGDGDVTVTVLSDGAERSFSGFGKIRVNMRGRGFKAAVKGQGAVGRLYARFEVRK